MVKILHASGVNTALAGKAKHASFILLGGSSRQQADELTRQGMEEISLADVADEERMACERDYVNGVAALGAVHHSLAWWAHPLSEKNEHVSDHYRDLFLFLRLVKTIQRLPTAEELTLLVICGEGLKQQLRSYCSKNAITFKTLDNPLALRIRKGQLLLRGWLALTYVMITLVLRKIQLSLTPRLRLEDLLSAGPYYVIRTWIDDRFDEDRDGSTLPFFGKLPEYAAQKGHAVLLLAGVVGQYGSLIRKLRDSRSFLAIPEEYFVRYADLVRLLTHLQFRRVRLKDTVLFNGLDVTALYEEELQKGFQSPEYLRNILRYYLARRFAGRVAFSHYIQTFENYAWEKTMLLGLRHAGKGGITLGFQHAFLSRNSFKYFPGETERDIMPLPDRIITRGEITRDIMLKYGHYRPDVLQTGCALRQEYLHNAALVKRMRRNRIVVPLTMVPRESALTLEFLMDSGLPASGITVVIRCHPMAPPETFAKLLTRAVPDNFVFRNEKSVQEELATTDLVLYTWTTVAIEAVMMGIPVIYLDILTPLFVDPLFECAAFKRTVTKSSDLLGALQGFYSMDEAQFAQERETASVYLKKDFYPVTEENLAPFYAA